MSNLHNITNDKNDDKLFLDRFEERIYLPYQEAAQILENCRALTENTELNAFIQNIYFDTDDRAMPLGNATRIRKYLKNPDEEIAITGENIIDIGYTDFDKKTKRRYKGTLDEIVKFLNSEYPIRKYSFRPATAVTYERRIFSGEEIRVTLDYGISLYNITQQLESKRIMRLDSAIAEIKFKNTQNLNDIILEMRQKPTSDMGPSKHYLPYNAGYAISRPRELFKKLGYLKELEGEIEVKYDAKSHDAYMNFIISISNGKLPGFQLLKVYDKPVSLESINEYKVLEDGKIARVMHTGVMPIKYVSKNKGFYTSYGALIRDEEKVEEEKDKIQKALACPTIAISRRIKRINYVRSDSGIIYNISVDLSQSKDHGALTQIEFEYLRSESKTISTSNIIANDFARLSKHIESVCSGSVFRSKLRKEDWLMNKTR